MDNKNYYVICQVAVSTTKRKIKLSEGVRTSSARGLVVAIIHIVIRKSRSGDLNKWQINYVGIY